MFNFQQDTLLRNFFNATFNLSGPRSESWHSGSVRLEVLLGMESPPSYKESFVMSQCHFPTARFSILVKAILRVFFFIDFQSRNSIMSSLRVISWKIIIISIYYIETMVIRCYFIFISLLIFPAFTNLWVPLRGNQVCFVCHFINTQSLACMNK